MTIGSRAGRPTSSRSATTRRCNPGSSRIDTVLFSGTGEWNGRDGYRYQMSVVDLGDAWHPNLCVKLTVTSPAGVVVASVNGRLTSGGCTLTRAFRR